MQNLTVICVGKLKEKEFSALQDEYTKRLKRFCQCEVVNIEEQRLPAKPSQAEIQQALDKEAAQILTAIPKGAYICALCIEGKSITSEAFSKLISDVSFTTDKLCFIIGGSCGLSPKIKQSADFKLSFSPMTFPHHLFRIMLFEQIYRAFTIKSGTGYHK